MSPDGKRELLRRLLIAEQAGTSGQAILTEALSASTPQRPETRFEPFPLNETQQAYWIGRADGLVLGGVSAHIYYEFESSTLDLPRLELSWRKLIERHDMLRAIILPDGTQRVLPDVPPYVIQVTDLTCEPPSAVAAALDHARSRRSHQVLPAARWPLFELAATRLPGGITRLYMGIEILIADAWSIQQLMAEWRVLYENPAARLEPLSLTFRDYTYAAAALETTPEFHRALEHWRDRMATLPPPPALPLARDKDDRRVRFVRRSARLSQRDWETLKSRAEAGGLTPSGVLLAAFSEVLAAWSQHPQFAISMTLFHRYPIHRQVTSIIGDFTSLSLLAVDASIGATFRERARRIQETLWEDLEHQAVSAVRVLRELAREGRRAPGMTMGIVFTSTLNKHWQAECAPSDWLGKTVYSITQTPQVLLDHQVYEMGGELSWNWDAVEDWFAPGVLDSMFEAYRDLIVRLATAPATWDETVPVRLPAAELSAREVANSTDVQVPETTLSGLFCQAAGAYPDQLAVLSDRRQMSYRELTLHSEHYARALNARGVGRGDLVAVVMEKGWEQVVATLSVLKAGAAYLPIEPDLPRDRRFPLFRHARVKVALTQPWLLHSLEWPDEVTPLVVTDDPPPELGDERVDYARPDDLAYVIYTSGSSGTPKGVMVRHSAAVNTICDLTRRLKLDQHDRVLALSSLGFDLSVFDIFGLLAVGGTIVIPGPVASRDPACWDRLVRDHRVSLWNSVPALMQMFITHLADTQGEVPQSLRTILLSGDWIPVDLPAEIRERGSRAHILSLGGATEAAIWSIAYPIAIVDPGWPSIPYGKPLGNQRVHIFDSMLRARPVWVAGELYIAGRGLADGYLADDVQTAAAFIRHPETSERMYRTGDLGRYLPSGDIEFLGREDAQVKIHGHRIELGEIEGTLCRHPAVRHAATVVSAGENGAKRLIAYVVLDERGAGGLTTTQTAPGPGVENRFLDARRAGEEALARLSDDDGALHASLGADLDRMTIAAVARALVSLGVFRRVDESCTIDEIVAKGRILPRYRVWLARAVGSLLAYGCLVRDDGRLRSQPSLFDLAKDAASAVRDLLERSNVPEPERFRPAFEFVARGATALAAVLTGEENAGTLLFGEGSLAAERLYGAAFAQCHGVLSAMCAVLARESSSFRVVEIGAGVGSSTAHVVPVLPAGRSSYLYTDVSPYFLEVGQRLFGTFPWMRFAVCDIERDPNLQGIEPHSFDLVVASSVLHATRDIAETLANVRSLLAPGGILLMVEETRFHHVFNLTMGLQPGFDRFADRHLRRDHPLLAASAWRAALAAAGMGSVASFTAEGSSAGFWGLTVLMAQGPLTVAKLEEDALLAFARTKLPEYMVPARFVRLSSLPVSANGKLDRRMLSHACRSSGLSGAASHPPRTPTESKLARIWAETLRIDRVGRNDNFFELGGDSLVATQLVSKVRAQFNLDVPLRAIFERPTLAAMAAIVDERRGVESESHRAKPAACSAIKVVPAIADRYRPFPLTDVQQAYWLGRRGAFELGNISCRLYVEIDAGQLDLERFEAALQRLIQRHDMLRAVMLRDAQQQILEAVPPFHVHVVDLSHSDAADADAALAHVRAELSHAVRDPEVWPLFDVRATQLVGGRTRLHLGFDLLIGDAWSFLLLAGELSTLLEQPDADLPPLGITFRDYVLAEQLLEDTPAYQEALAYWRRRIQTLPPAPDLPLARQPETLARPRFSRRTASLNAPLWQALKTLATATGLTPSGVLLAAFAEVLALWTHTPRFTLNLTLFHRLPVHPDVERIVGDFTSLVLLEVDPGDEVTFEGRARRLQAQLWEDLDRRIVSGVRVLRERARAEHSGGKVGMPVVFTSTLTLGSLPGGTSGLSRLGKVVYAITQTPQVWLDHQVMEQEGALLYHWDAIDELFPEGLLDAMFETYARLLGELASDGQRWREPRRPAIPDSELVERQRANDTAGPLSLRRLEEPFFARAREYPGSPVVIALDRVLTYGELAARARALAARLNHLGAGSGNLVAVVTEKGWEQVVAVLGVLTSGAAYVPVDPTLPPARIHEILRDTAVKLVVTDSAADRIAWPAGLRRIRVAEVEITGHSTRQDGQALAPGDIAYVIYTSGSTGLPKGVAVDHRAACNTLDDINERFAVSRADRVLAVSSLGFDLSVYDIFGTLAAGGAIVMPDPSIALDPAHWEDLARRHAITLWNSVPALFELFVRRFEEMHTRLPPSLRLAMLSGDWLPVSLPDRARRLTEELTIASLGGATEASIWSIAYPVGRIDPTCASVPYGRPLRNQRCYVLDASLEPRPVWVAGDLYIAGEGLARGYLGHADKTAAAFVMHPKTGERLYRTGDIARYLRDGTLELLGRADTRVKVHGHRIELGEIKSVIEQHPDVRAAEALLHVDPEGVRRLVAYVVPAVALAADCSNSTLVPGGPESDGEYARPCTAPQVALLDPLDDDRRALVLRERRSQRQFADQPVTASSMGALLANLRTLEIDGLGKRAYPSAGHLYAVQAYLYCKPDRVEDVKGGLYEYDPDAHRLLLVAPDVRFAVADHVAINQPVFEASAFMLFLVGNVGLVARQYGAMARDFCLLETGAIVQILMAAAPRERLGLCPIGNLVAGDVASRLRLGDGQAILHALLGGTMPAGPPAAWSFVTPPIRTRRQFVRTLERHLRRRLPAYMVPSMIVTLDSMPLGPNGKVARDALTPPLVGRSSKSYTAPRTPTEQAVALIWQTALRVERVSVEESFFDLGGDSLVAVQLLSRIRARFGVDLPISVLLDGSSIAGMARMLDQQQSLPGSVECSPAKLSEPSISVPVRRESRPLERLIESRELAPIDSAALFAVPAAVLDPSPVIRQAIREALLNNGPRLCAMLTTQWGHIGLFFLPLLDQDLYVPASRLTERVTEAAARAGQLGARTVSLTGLIPSALSIIDGWGELRAHPELPSITSGHATTVAAVVMTIRQVLSLSGRALSDQSVAFVGLGSIGQNVARMVASDRTPPARIALCDVFGTQARLQQLREELLGELGYRGEVTLALAKHGEPPALGDATLIVGATNVANVIDVGLLRPGTLLIDDSAPHCFNKSQAIARFETAGDLLFTEGGALRLPDPIERLVSVSEDFERQIPPDLMAPWLRAWLGVSPAAIMGCTFSGLLSGKVTTLPVTGDVITQAAVKAHLDALAELGIHAGDIACEDYLLDSSGIARFCRRS